MLSICYLLPCTYFTNIVHSLFGQYSRIAREIKIFWREMRCLTPLTLNLKQCVSSLFNARDTWRLLTGNDIIVWYWGNDYSVSISMKPFFFVFYYVYLFLVFPSIANLPFLWNPFLLFLYSFNFKLSFTKSNHRMSKSWPWRELLLLQVLALLKDKFRWPLCLKY